MVIPLSHWYHFGLLQSAIHETWAWSRGSTLKGDLRYTNTTIFETFPFPLHPDGAYDPRKVPKSEKAEQLAEAAKAFDELRTRTCKELQLGLTKVHNLLEAGELPALANAYGAMNGAASACYGWPRGTWAEQADVLARLLVLNGEIAAADDGS